MNQTRPDNPATIIGRWILRLALLAFMGYVIWRTRAIIVTVLLSAVFAATLEPIVSFLGRYRIKAIPPKPWRLASTIVVFTLAFAAVLMSVSWLAKPFGNELGRIGDYASFARSAISEVDKDLKAVYSQMPAIIKELLPNKTPAQFSEKFYELSARIFQSAKDWLSHLWEIFIIPVLAFYFVADSSSIKKYAVSFVLPRYRREAVRLIRDATLVFQNYIVGQIILCLIAGIFMGFLLTYLKVKYALTLAVFAGITRAVPIVGPIVSGVAIVLVIMATDAILAAKVLLIFSIMHFVESKLIMPVLIGERMRLHPALLLVAILVGYEFFGILGMFLAAPVTAMARTLINTYYIERRDEKLKDAERAVKATQMEIQSLEKKEEFSEPNHPAVA